MHSCDRPWSNPLIGGDGRYSMHFVYPRFQTSSCTVGARTISDYAQSLREKLLVLHWRWIRSNVRPRYVFESCFETEQVLDRVAREEIFHVSACSHSVFTASKTMSWWNCEKKKKTYLHFTDASEHVRLFSTWIASCCLFFFTASKWMHRMPSV